MVWGQVGHHPLIPKEFIRSVYGWKAYYKDRFLWMLKNIFWYLDPILAICKRKASLVICMNTEAVKKLRLKKNYIIHPSVAAEKGVTADPTQLTGGFKILSIGRFVPLKGFDLTIKSFAKFYSALPVDDRETVSLVLAGSGPYQKQLKKIAKDLKVDRAIEFVEWMPREEVDELYRQASVFLFPSHEGAGMVVPEAMSYGLPVVCLQNCGPGELVHPDSGLAVAYAGYDLTIDLIADQLSKLYTNADRMKFERKLSAARFKELFRWDVRGEMLKEAYQLASRNFYNRTKCYPYEKEKNFCCSLAK